MASLCQKFKCQKPAKFMTRRKNRCQICGRPRAFMRKFSICRCCFRQMSSSGLIPGIRKASW